LREGIHNIPKQVDTIVISTQHTPDVELKRLREDILEKVIKPTIPSELLDKDT
jgi:S-adenosylmethionine synthetase